MSNFFVGKDSIPTRKSVVAWWVSMGTGLFKSFSVYLKASDKLSILMYAASEYQDCSMQYKDLLTKGTYLPLAASLFSDILAIMSLFQMTKRLLTREWGGDREKPLSDRMENLPSVRSCFELFAICLCVHLIPSTFLGTSRLWVNTANIRVLKS